MTFADAIRSCLRKYVTFSGRATRPEYWWFVLFIVVGGIVTGILDSTLFGETIVESDGSRTAVGSDGPISSIFSLATLIPLLAAGWRRMHDTGRSGLYLLYPILVWIGIASFASMIGATSSIMSGDFGSVFAGITGIILAISVIIAVFSPFIVLWWLSRPTQPGPNDFGPNPNEVPA